MSTPPRKVDLVAPSRTINTAGQELPKPAPAATTAIAKSEPKKAPKPRNKAKSQFDALENGQPPDADQQAFLRKFDRAADEAQKFAAILREEQANARPRPKEAGIGQVDHDVTRTFRLLTRWLTE